MDKNGSARNDRRLNKWFAPPSADKFDSNCKALTPKQRVLATLNRQPVDRLPVGLWHTPEISATLRKHFGLQVDFAMWKALDIDKIMWDFMNYKTDAGERAGGQSGAGRHAAGKYLCDDLNRPESLNPPIA